MTFSSFSIWENFQKYSSISWSYQSSVFTFPYFFFHLHLLFIFPSCLFPKQCFVVSKLFKQFFPQILPASPFFILARCFVTEWAQFSALQKLKMRCSVSTLFLFNGTFLKVYESKAKQQLRVSLIYYKAHSDAVRSEVITFRFD